MKSLNFNEKRVLRQLIDSASPWQVAGHARLDFPRVVRTLKQLERKGLVSIGKAAVTLTPLGLEASREAGLRSTQHILRQTRIARREFNRIAKQRPSSIGIYDQGYMEPADLFRRVSSIGLAGDLEQKRIAILGDDDLLSIALCLAGSPRKVSVFEIDPRIVDFILEVARKRDLPIEAECHDLRKPLPSRLKGCFDTFVCDPSETMPGLKMFLGRGLFLLGPGEGKAGYFGLTMIEASTRKWSAIQEWLLARHALAITDITGTSYYRNWPDLLSQTEGFSLRCLRTPPVTSWFNSSLVRIETLREFKPKQMGRIKGSIFYDREASGRPVRAKPTKTKAAHSRAGRSGSRKARSRKVKR